MIIGIHVPKDRPMCVHTVVSFPISPVKLRSRVFWKFQC